MGEMTEIDIMHKIMLAVSSAGHKIFRVNVGAGWLSRTRGSADARYFKTGVPPGYSDLSGCRGDNGRAIFIECKTATGRATQAQEQFILQMLLAGANAGIARNAEEALEICDMTEDEREVRINEAYDRLEKIRGSRK